MKTRLQRFLADCGVASRRECEEMIAAGRVRVNGEVRTKMPVMVVVGKDIITVDEEEVTAEGGGSAVVQGEETLREQAKVYFLLNKPKGILVTTSDPSGRKTVGELMTGVKERVFPVGRLDMDSRGALIMTNDGELANRLTHPRYGIEKTYIVEVDGRLGHGEIEKIKRGMWLGPVQRGGVPAGGARPGGATRTDRFHVRLVGRERGRTIMEIKLTEAKNREIRRVMARIGHNVRDLNRVAIAGKVTIKNLEVGKYRPLSEAEVKWLLKASSPEFHQSEKAATQAWYEAKEMAKERKRLARQAAEGPEEVEDQDSSAEEAADERPAGGRREREREERRPRPERKGRKPFVPPSGRNAGKMLGGDFRGRKRVAQQETMDGGDEETLPKMEGTGDLPSHPLGDAAGDDE